ncbi:small ribosomal subunit protein uS11m-like [Tubulanus polymorphus]|uniref:small ribosomal subunit protein uS11m-like n=1 Tax=Tubulanus polymorphus TaxID=672921 RepID=UPI003DA3C535
MLRRVVVAALPSNRIYNSVPVLRSTSNIYRLSNDAAGRMRSLHLSAANFILDKDVKSKKELSKARNRDVTVLDAPSEDVDVELEGMFQTGIPIPTAETHSMVIDDKLYSELPIMHIKATHNNTHIDLTDHNGTVMTHASAGFEGFRNAKKGTNIAAQAVGMSMGEKAINKGSKYVRVIVKGLGPGRLSAIKGLTMSGVIVVSITDNTYVPIGGDRPRKAKRL